MENQKETEVVHTEDYNGNKIKILLEKGLDFKRYKIIINGNGQTTDKYSVEEALIEAKNIIDENLKQKKQKKRKMS